MLFLKLIMMVVLGMSGLTANAEDVPAFDVLEYRVEGNTVLPAEKIEAAVYPFMGEKRNIDDAEQARAALEKAYHDAGYLTVFVNIPEQKVDSGVVLLEVKEGQVEKLRVVGSRYYSLGVIKERVPEFAEGKVPYFPEAQKQLASVNGAPDRRVTPVMRPAKTPGKIEVDLKVEDKLPFHGGIELNNHYSANTTRTRLSGSVRYDNLWQRDHSLGFSFYVSPENIDETKVISATYMIPTGGDYWALYGVLSDSNVSSTSGSISNNVVGKGNIYGLRYIHPLPEVEGYTHSLTLGVDYKDFKQTSTAMGDEPISYMPFFVGYDGTLQQQESTTQLNMGVTFSMRGLADDQMTCLDGFVLNEFECKRYLAKANFAYLRTELKHTQKFFNGWQFYGVVSGQLSNQPLISYEQLSIGGVNSVRGYLESTSVGDDGLTARLELRTPSFAKYLSEKVSDFYALAFYDAAQVHVQDAIPGNPALGIPDQQNTFRLASAGLGLRVKGWGLTGKIDYARALRDEGDVESGDFKWHASLGYDW